MLAVGCQADAGGSGAASESTDGSTGSGGAGASSGTASGPDPASGEATGGTAGGEGSESGADTEGETPTPSSRYRPTHYVAPDARGGGDGSFERPWTWDEAYRDAMAGDVVQFAPGTYVSPGSASRDRPYTPSNTGEPDRPIVFFAEYPAVYHEDQPDLHALLFTEAPDSSVTGADAETRYVIWDGFSLRQGPGSTFTSEQSVFSGWSGGQQFKILRCLFDQQGLGQMTGANNWGALFLQDVSFVEVADCIFRNVPGADESTCVFNCYRVGELELHHCLFENNHCNFIIKGDMPDAPFHNAPQRWHHNRFVDWTYERAFTLLGVNEYGTEEHWDMYQCVFQCSRLTNLWYESFGDFPRYFRIVNNTFIFDLLENDGVVNLHRVVGPANAENGIFQSCLFQNNIVSCAGPIDSIMGHQFGESDAVGQARFVHRHNLYTPAFSDGSFLGRSLEDWNAFGDNRGELRGEPALLDDGSLGEGSAAFDVGVDVLELQGLGDSAPINAGAYVSADASEVIGIRPSDVTNADAPNFG